MKVIRNLRDNKQVKFLVDTIAETKIEIELTDEEIEKAYTEFLERKFIRDTEYYLEENYVGEFDKETVASIAEDYKEALGNQIERLENEVFDDVMELNYPEYERNY